jgi:D-glycero-D-manno-heptose 1,7-bisphosphate phosphatase
MKKAVFLDRDGVINERATTEGEYITRWEELHFLPGVVEAITLLNRAGFLVIIVSNQRCIAKGLLTSAGLDSIHRRMCRELKLLGATIDAIYYCPHEEQPPCECRKPQAGMLFAAAAECEIDLSSSWMIGDSDKDIEAGKRAECRTARITQPEAREGSRADLIAGSLLEAAQMILRLELANSTHSSAISVPPELRCQ